MRPLTVVMIVPTGIGCAIGGHSGDATWAARLLGASCDRLILHPNVANGSDLNEMPENALYVEGSILDQFLAHRACLRLVHGNRLAVMCNDPDFNTINAVNAARMLRGMSIKIVNLDVPLIMNGIVTADGASGDIEGQSELISQCSELDVDAIAIHTPISVGRSVAERYIEHGGINPWGGVEAMLTRAVGTALQLPVAHAPVETMEYWDGPSVPGLGAEMSSRTHLFSVLKGLHQSPRIVSFNHYRGGDVVLDDVDVLVSPLCYGEPHRCCIEFGIPVIYIANNTTIFGQEVIVHDKDIVAKDYVEAAGRLRAISAGITIP